MAPKNPVAIRVTRPYATVDELLAAELDTITRTGIVLIGAPHKPDGAVLRFELALADGTPILRGEGRVIGTKKIAAEEGLALRFTRLDSKSKAVVDKAGALRDAPKPRTEPPPPEPSPPEPAPNATDDQSGQVVAVSGEVPITTSSAEIPIALVSETVVIPEAAARYEENERPTSQGPREEELEVQAPAKENGARRGPTVVPALPKEARESLLDRLRERGKKLSPEDIARLLTKP